MGTRLQSQSFAAAICLAIFLSGLALSAATAKSISEDNGHDWEMNPRMSKLDIVKGFVMASNYMAETVSTGIHPLYQRNPRKAHELYVSMFQKNKKRTYSQVEAMLIAETVSTMRDEALLRCTVTEATLGQIVDGVDVFYQDFRNKGIRIAEGIHFVKKQIQGTSNEELEAILQYLRSPNRDPMKLIVTGKDGKPVLYYFP